MTSKSSELRELLRRRAAIAARECGAEASLYKSRETFVLAYGRNYVSAPFVLGERAQLQGLLRKCREFWRRGFAYNQCFTNAQELLAFDTTGTLVYAEGFVWGYADKLPPVHHGWLSLHGKVIDLTAPTRATARKVPSEPPQVHGEFDGRVYFGVPFLRRYVRERAKANMGWGSLLDDGRSGDILLLHGGDGAVRSRA